MDVTQFKQLSTRLIKNTSSVTTSDLCTVNTLLNTNIKCGRIKFYSLEVSQAVATFTLKHNVLILVEFLVRKGVKIPTNIINVIVDILLNSDVCIEVESLKAQINVLALDILSLTDVNEYSAKVEDYLATQEVLDQVNVNLAVLVKSKVWKAYDLRVLNELIIGPELLGLIRAFKKALRPVVKDRLLQEASSYLLSSSPEHRKILYCVFYELNSKKNMQLMDITEDSKEEEYVAFVLSLMVDIESYTRGYEILRASGLFNDLTKVIKSLNSMGDLELLPEDEALIFHLLQVVNKLTAREHPSLRNIKMHFMHLVDLILRTLCINVSLRIKGQIYDILGSYMRDENISYSIVAFVVQQNLVGAMYKNFELENGSFYLTPKFLNFCYFLSPSQEILAFAIYALKSEDPSVYVAAFPIFIHSIGASEMDINDSESQLAVGDSVNQLGNLISKLPVSRSTVGTGPLQSPDASVEKYLQNQLILMAQHIRATMLKSPYITEVILNFQLGTRILINDVSVISTHISSSSSKFFSYVRLFNDFSFFLTDDFLERLGEDPTCGLEWMRDETKSNSDICNFVISNARWFNYWLKDLDVKDQGLLLEIYENIISFDIEIVDVVLCTDSENTDSNMVFMLPDIPHPALFDILSKLLIYAKYNNLNFRKFITNTEYKMDEECLRKYCLYIKCRIVVGDDVWCQIKYLMRQYPGSPHLDDLIGYYKVCSNDDMVISDQNVDQPDDMFVGREDAGQVNNGQTKVISHDSRTLDFGVLPSNSLLWLLNFSNPQLFINRYRVSNTFEKYLLYFCIGTEISKEVESIVKEEITRLCQSTHAENRLILRQCINTLLLCENIDGIVRMLDDYEDVELMLKVNIRNLCNGGNYFNRKLMNKGPISLQIYAVLLIYMKNIWNLHEVSEWIEKLRIKAPNDEELRYLIRVVNVRSGVAIK